MIRVTTLLALMAVPAMADVTAPGGRKIDCFCTDTQGARVEMGQTICLYVDGRAFMARCEMSLNNPMWREVSKGCMSSEIRQSVPAKPAG